MKHRQCPAQSHKLSHQPSHQPSHQSSHQLTQRSSVLHSPPHPACILREGILPSLGMSITAAAKHLGVSRSKLSRLLGGCAPITAEFALQIQAWLGEDRGNARLWLLMQLEHDLWHAQERLRSRRVTRP